MRSRYIAVTLAVVAQAIMTSAGAQGASVNAAAEYRAALRLAGSESVHFVSKAAQQGVVLQAVGDSGRSAGSQVLVVESGSTVETLEIIRSGSTGYVRGNATALQRILGLTAAQSTAFTGTWLSFPAGDAGLSDLLGGLRSQDVAAELTMSGPYTLGESKRIGGHATRGIDGFASTSTGTRVGIELYVETGATPRPVEEVTRASVHSTTIQGTVTFSKWGEKNHIKAPPHAFSIGSLSAQGG